MRFTRQNGIDRIPRVARTICAGRGRSGHIQSVLESLGVSAEQVLADGYRTLYRLTNLYGSFSEILRR